MPVMVCRFGESAGPTHQKYDAKSNDTRQNHVPELCGICNHRQSQPGHAFYGLRSSRVTVRNQLLNPVDGSKLRLGT